MLLVATDRRPSNAGAGGPLRGSSVAARSAVARSRVAPALGLLSSQNGLFWWRAPVLTCRCRRRSRSLCRWCPRWCLPTAGCAGDRLIAPSSLWRCRSSRRRCWRHVAHGASAPGSTLAPPACSSSWRVRWHTASLDRRRHNWSCSPAFVAMTASWFGHRDIAASLAARSLSRQRVRLYHVGYQTLIGAVQARGAWDGQLFTWLALVVAVAAAAVVTGRRTWARAGAAASPAVLHCAIGLMLALLGTLLLGGSGSGGRFPAARLRCSGRTGAAAFLAARTRRLKAWRPAQSSSRAAGQRAAAAVHAAETSPGGC